MTNDSHLLNTVRKLIGLTCCVVALVVVSMILIIAYATGAFKEDDNTIPTVAATLTVPTVEEILTWKAPDSTSVPHNAQGNLIRYGRELIAHTSVYLGPKGKVRAITNGMNCQNCHLQGGSKAFGNNYGKVASTYPKFRARSGSVEDVPKRINDCIERSLNGQPLDRESEEMKAIMAYILWVGKDVKKDEKINGMGILELKPLDRAADPARGKIVYVNVCQRCHGANGEGLRAASGLEWTYPPLFGPESYNVGAGLYRLSRFAGYVKANMPDGTTFDKPLLSDEEAWDVAAYVNSMSRPSKDLSADWPDIAAKPFDHPFGPYADSFSEQQHKFGPFAPIVAKKK